MNAPARPEQGDQNMNASARRPERRRKSTLVTEHPAFTAADEPGTQPDEVPGQREPERPRLVETPREIPREIDHEIDRTAPGGHDREEPGEPAGRAAPRGPVAVGELPNLEVDLDDPTGLIPSPTVINVRASVMRRFEAARGKGTTHTGLMLDALRATATRLVDLVTQARPGTQEGDLFPWRPSPGSSRSADKPQPLRVRPTVAELGVIDALVNYVDGEVRRRRPGSPKVSRSELVTAALDEFLPAARRRR